MSPYTTWVSGQGVMNWEAFGTGFGNKKEKKTKMGTIHSFIHSIYHSLCVSGIHLSTPTIIVHMSRDATAIFHSCILLIYHVAAIHAARKTALQDPGFQEFHN